MPLTKVSTNIQRLISILGVQVCHAPWFPFCMAQYGEYQRQQEQQKQNRLHF